jgi:hypothetical protein
MDGWLTVTTAVGTGWLKKKCSLSIENGILSNVPYAWLARLVLDGELSGKKCPLWKVYYALPHNLELSNVLVLHWAGKKLGLKKTDNNKTGVVRRA